MTSPRVNTMNAQSEGPISLGILAPLTYPGFRLPPLQQRPLEEVTEKFRRPWPVRIGLETIGR